MKSFTDVREDIKDIEEGKINSFLAWSALKLVPKNNADKTKINLKHINHPLTYPTVTQKKATCQKTPYVISIKRLK